MQAGTCVLDEQHLGLPELPSIALTLRYQQAERSVAVERLSRIVLQAIKQHLE
jgi:hypothetical protein